ncbi:MAG: EscU/YscU/HrcU family type III secretion system export apparatus switch protein [Clostridiales bacterium]|jgi:flagellar biosynthesis protein|nr:EscU/YscU/HrcU family type III secretion system export apparatus switch protein [Clostridiales bacterium]
MEKRKMAAEITYIPGDTAPRVSAKGSGEAAQRMLAKVKGGVPVISDPDLVKDLMGIDIGEYIPTDLYEVVAQVLVFISMLDKNQDS